MAFEIKAIHAFVTKDNPGGDEGIIGMATQAGWIPLIAADQERLEQLREYAQEFADKHGLNIKLVRFTQREDIEEIKSKGSKS